MVYSGLQSQYPGLREPAGCELSFHDRYQASISSEAESGRVRDVGLTVVTNSSLDRFSKPVLVFIEDQCGE